MVDAVFLINDDVVVKAGTGRFLADMKQISKERNGIVVDPALYRNNGKSVAMGFCYIPKYILDNVGLFDKKFKMLEWDDTDLSIRIQEAGYTLNKLNYDCIGELTGGIALSQFTTKQKDEVKKNKERFKKKWKGTKWETFFK